VTQKIALVTGAGRRVGRAIAVGLAGDGYDVAVHYHGSETGAGETLDAVKRLGRAGTLLAADLRAAAAARALADRTVKALGGLHDRTVKALGGLHALVNSAAVMVRQPIEEVTPESWDATLELNLRAGFFVAQGAIPHLRRSRGSIVNIADVAAFEPWPAYVPHCVSKAGVVMLTKGLARALAPDITVNAVAPGPVLLPEEWDEATQRHFAETTPLQRLGTPEDVVAAVRFLLTSAYTTGTVLVVDGGRLIR